MGGSPCFRGLAGECHRIKTSFDCGLVTIMSRHWNGLLGAGLGHIGLETAKISRFFLEKPREGLRTQRKTRFPPRRKFSISREKNIFSTWFREHRLMMGW